MLEYCTDELGVSEALQLLTKYGEALQGLKYKTNAIPETGNPLLPMDYAYSLRNGFLCTSFMGWFDRRY
ncbi:hypothetical protein EMCG_01163 [[Emmonsia] crescens]|uniref:Uncharacterized protein n=1 Tax=[Emmonsia] crescens TaxID=73230 RepID=A0A0G2I658_9EURO|nr:hypothetical protein EMCG_01163 [Emmonsia crescens UAMH 3008]